MDDSTATVEPTDDLSADAAQVTSDPFIPDPAVDTPPDLSILPSVLGELRKSRQQIGSGAAPIDIPIPGYQGKLIARFKWVPVTALAATAASLRKIKDPTTQQLAAVADALAATNDEILVHSDPETDPQSLTYQGAPCTFQNGEGLALALGFAAPRSARECVNAVFNNEYAMVDVAQRVMQWLEDTSREVDESFLGE